MKNIKIFTQDDITDTKNFRLSLQRNHIHIWKIKWKHFKKTENKDYANYIKSVLTSEELKKADRFYREDDTSRSFLSRGLTRIIAQAYTGKKAESIKINTEPSGKPIFTDEKSLKFNISHSGDYILIAFVHEKNIGIDVEKQDRNIDIKGILTFFSEEERRSFSNTDDYRDFYKLWVRKEAYLKCTGEGLSRGLDTFTIIGDSVKQDKNIILKGIDIDDEYLAALAIKA